MVNKKRGSGSGSKNESKTVSTATFDGSSPTNATTIHNAAAVKTVGIPPNAHRMLCYV